MRQVVTRTSTYSSDEFGVCSALYELGGMVVMHDASGCNSTYTTHDEPRWYDIDSMIYISAISEMEAIMGDDGKFIQDLTETASKLKPAFVALVGAPIPYMTGTDFPAIAKIVEQNTGIPCFGFSTNGMEYYTQGISMALETLVRHYCTESFEKPAEKIRVNLLGATPLDFSVNGTVEAIKAWLSENGFDPGVTIAMGDLLDTIKKASSAHVNLVLSYGGLAAARILKERFGIPYICGVPYGKDYSKALAARLRDVGKQVCTSKPDPESSLPADNDQAVQALIIGESIGCVSLACALEMEHPELICRVICPVDTEEGLLRDGDIQTDDEEEIHREMQKADLVIADPLYRMLCPEKRFIELPHTAFSGRIYEKSMPVLIGKLPQL